MASLEAVADGTDTAEDMDIGNELVDPVDPVDPVSA